jgi:mono/diheme cytochrome c family protein
MRRRALLATGILCVAAIAISIAAIAVTELRWTRRFSAPYPAIAATTDPVIVAQGEYIVYAAAACAYCHVPREQWSVLDGGARLPLTGNHLFRLPFGEIYSSNLTPDANTGIGRRSDPELARILRYGVRADGRAAFPLMDIQLSDGDLVAVVSYLRSRSGVALAVPDHRLTRFGKALMSFAIAPAAATARPPIESPSGISIERGRYLANNVSSCVACHTDRGGDGALVGAPFGGGQRMDVAADSTKVYVTANLTPDAATSVIGRWTEDDFVMRFRSGEAIEGTPMPWGAFARMTEADLRAIYRYLRSLPPVAHQTGPAVQPALD